MEVIYDIVAHHQMMRLCLVYLYLVVILQRKVSKVSGFYAHIWANPKVFTTGIKKLKKIEKVVDKSKIMYYYIQAVA